MPFAYFVLRKCVTAVNIKSVQRKLSRYKFIMFSGSVNPQILRSKSVQKGKEVPLSALRSSTSVWSMVRCFTKEQQIQGYDQRRVSYPLHISIIYWSCNQNCCFLIMSYLNDENGRRTVRKFDRALGDWTPSVLDEK